MSHLEDKDFPIKDKLESRTALWNGGSMIVNPRGKIVAKPLVGKEGIIYANIDPLVATQERQEFDISGNYSRFDIFNKP